MLEKVETDKGFFRKYHGDIESSLDEVQWKTFEGLSTNEERFNFVLKLKTNNEFISQVKCDKDFDLAIKLKKLGNKAFQEQKYTDACKLYTESALKIPWETGSSSELAVIIANRSAALYHLQEHELTIADVELALSLDYPLELRYKAIDRKARCLLAKKQLKDAVFAFRETLTALDSSKLSIERKRKWQLDVQIMLGMLGKNPSHSNAPLSPISVDQKPVLPGENSLYKSASTAIRIDKSQEMGRYAVATRNVKVGETLVFEPAFCSVLLEEHSKTHCFQCFKRVKTPLPCPRCSIIVFCGIKCQRTALMTHHRIECTILTTLWSSGASVTCLMALRIFSQSTMKHFLSLKPQLGQVQVHQRGDYLDVYNLVTHEAKRKSDDLFHRANMAVFLYKCLKISGYFDDHTSQAGEDPTPSESYIGGLLLHNLQLLQFNAHEISELVLGEDGDVEAGQSIFLGGGLYPTLALFNHSCDPGVTRYFLGTSVVVQAVKNIQCGNMIAENYGPIFTQTAKSERQSTLRNQYWFLCNCVPCEEDWPLFNDMDPNILRFKCFGEGNITCSNVIEVSVNTMEFLIQCSACKQYTNILKGLKALQDTDSLFKKAKTFMVKKDILNALNTFSDLLNRLDETLAPPFRDYHLCQQGIRRCMLFLGNHYQKKKIM